MEQEFDPERERLDPSRTQRRKVERLRQKDDECFGEEDIEKRAPRPAAGAVDIAPIHERYRFPHVAVELRWVLHHGLQSETIAFDQSVDYRHRNGMVVRAMDKPVDERVVEQCFGASAETCEHFRQL